MHQKLVFVAILLCIGCTPKPAVSDFINLGDTYEVKGGQIVAFATLDEAFEQCNFREQIRPGQNRNDVALLPDVRADLEARIKSTKLYLPNERFTLKSVARRTLAGRLVDFYELDSGFWLYESDLNLEVLLGGITKVEVLNLLIGNSH